MTVIISVVALTLLLISLVFFRKQPVYLVDFSCYKPPEWCGPSRNSPCATLPPPRTRHSATGPSASLLCHARLPTLPTLALVSGRPVSQL